jgi:hypothetical protein
MRLIFRVRVGLRREAKSRAKRKCPGAELKRSLSMAKMTSAASSFGANSTGSPYASTAPFETFSREIACHRCQRVSG